MDRSRRQRRGFLRLDRANLHFVVAGVILAVSTIAWNSTVRTLKWALHKDPVPWPQGVTVNADFNLQSLPLQMGPYRMVQEDGVLDRDDRGELVKDGLPDGELALKEEDKAALGIGTSADKSRWPSRSSNWYSSRIYEDTRPDARYRLWRMDLYYYTGMLDKVPHVPERCLVAGGAVLLGGQSVTFAPNGVDPRWSHPAVRRTRYEVSSRDRFQSRQYADYYVFSLNGVPEDSWEVVRLRLNDPRLRRCYFAKIQFTPLGEVMDIAQTDTAAGEFFCTALPYVLKVLPTPEQVAAPTGTPGEAPDTRLR